MFPTGNASSLSICTENGTKMFCVQNYFLDERDRCRIARLVQAYWKGTVTQIIFFYNHGEEKNISDCTMTNLEADGLNQQDTILKSTSVSQEH